MFLKAALNGGRTKHDHPRTPIAPGEIAADAAAAIRLGADVIHAHARDRAGAQSIQRDDIDAMLTAIRAAAPGAQIGTTTGLWTCQGDHHARCAAIAGWQHLPDFASVAFSEPGAAEAAELVIDRGMQLESAVWTLDDVPALLASPTLDENIRILIEPPDEDPDIAVANARTIADELRRAGVRAPLLYHGEDATVWPLLRAAIADGAQTRIGFEDGLHLPDGQLAADNGTLIKAALTIRTEHREIHLATRG